MHTSSPQLEMSLASLDRLPEAELADGYRLRTYRTGDLAAWGRLVSECIGGQYDEAACRESLLMDTPQFAPEDLFFLEKDGEAIGTACALRKHAPGEGPGYLHMVAVTAAHRGQRLGRPLVIAALRRFGDLGYRDVILSTDDFRLAAIRTYLDLGFLPVRSHESHAIRWREVYEKLGVGAQHAVPSREEAGDATLSAEPSA
jgi:mycothiol synthase